MTFNEIFPQFLEGAKIKRSEWDIGAFIYNGEEIMSSTDDEYQIKKDDLIASDWEIDKTCYYSYDDAVKLMKKGAKMKHPSLWFICKYVQYSKYDGLFQFDNDITGVSLGEGVQNNFWFKWREK